jgi:hypothetical protein
MSYNSRVYRQRNANVHDEVKPQPFFSQQEKVNQSTGTRGFFQAKFMINKPGDNYETEADNTASVVASNSSRKPIINQTKINSIQRFATSAEDEMLDTNDEKMAYDKKIQRMPAQDTEMEKEDKTIQPKAVGNVTNAPAKISSQIESSAGKGNALPKKVLHNMNKSFGVNFGKVRIHDNKEAINMNKELHAHAFTHGNDIYFNEGKFDTQSTAGKFLLAHELTHVIQQNGDSIERYIQKSGDEQADPLAVQPGGPFDTNDQTYTLKWKDGQWEGCGALPGTAAGGENACISSDSIDTIKNYFKKKPGSPNVDRPVNCPPERWNFTFGYCCSKGKHIDPFNRNNCIPDKIYEEKTEPPVPSEKGDFEVPDSDVKIV